MKAKLAKSTFVSDTDLCQPITCTRPLSQTMVANARLADILQARAAEAVGGGEDNSRLLWVCEDCWLTREVLANLVASSASSPVVVDSSGRPMAWLGEEGDATAPAQAGNADALSPDADSFRILYPWDLLHVNELLVGTLQETRIEGKVSPSSNIDGILVVGAGTRILPGVYIEGNVLIGKNCKIGPNCYIRGNTTIGDNCHIGQAVEVKNCLIMAGSSIGHLSYCGDSVIGEKVNFGAGTITANLRHDNCNQRSMVNNCLVDTKRRKLGVVIGDGVHTGINTSFFPGRKMWPHTATRPGTVVERDILA